MVIWDCDVVVINDAPLVGTATELPMSGFPSRVKSTVLERDFSRYRALYDRQCYYSVPRDAGQVHGISDFIHLNPNATPKPRTELYMSSDKKDCV